MEKEHNEVVADNEQAEIFEIEFPEPEKEDSPPLFLHNFEEEDEEEKENSPEVMAVSPISPQSIDDNTESSTLQKMHEMIISEGTNRFLSYKTLRSIDNQPRKLEFEPQMLINTPNSFVGVQKMLQKAEEEIQYVEDKKSLKVTNLRAFFYRSMEKAYKVTLVIHIQPGFLNLSEKYLVFVEDNNKFLFSVLKDGITGDFIFSTHKDRINTVTKSYLGKMVWNFSGSEYVLYDDGFDPTETRDLHLCHHQLLNIFYEEKKGPRKFEIIASLSQNAFYDLENDRNLLRNKWLKGDRTKMVRLYSRLPSYDTESGLYHHNLKRSDVMPSVKNFVLESEKFPECLIFSKRSQNEYILELKYPLSPLQGVAISISSIHRKLFWS